MARADDHAGEPRGVQQAFLLIEIPAAVLLRHQPALEPVGELGDDALEALQLRIEIGTQAAQFFVVAQLLGVDDLVEAGGEDAVVEPTGRLVGRPVRADGHHALLAVVGGLALGLGIGHLAFGLAVLFLAARVLFLVGRRLGIALVGRVGVFLGRVFLAVLVLALVALGIGVVVGHLELEVAQHVERQFLERFLVVEAQRQRLEIAARLCLDPLAHHIDAVLRGLGDRAPGQLLAQHQRQRGRQRHFVGRTGAGDRVAREAIVERGVEIFADPGIIVRAERLVADLLDRLVRHPRERVARHAAGVERFVVVPQPQREAIGRAARFSRSTRFEIAPGHRHPHRLAAGRRLVRGPGELDLVLAGYGARGTGERAAKIVERGTVFHDAVVTGSGITGSIGRSPSSP